MSVFEERCIRSKPTIDSKKSREFLWRLTSACLCRYSTTQLEQQNKNRISACRAVLDLFCEATQKPPASEKVGDLPYYVVYICMFRHEYSRRGATLGKVNSSTRQLRVWHTWLQSNCNSNKRNSWETIRCTNLTLHPFPSCQLQNYTLKQETLLGDTTAPNNHSTV